MTSVDYQRGYKAGYKAACADANRTTRDCEHCGLPFTPRRADARTCSPACRMALHRAAKANGPGDAKPSRAKAKRPAAPGPDLNDFIVEISEPKRLTKDEQVLKEASELDADKLTATERKKLARLVALVLRKERGITGTFEHGRAVSDLREFLDVLHDDQRVAERAA